MERPQESQRGCPSRQQQGSGFSGWSSDKDTKLSSVLNQGLSPGGPQCPAPCPQTHSWRAILNPKEEPASALTYHVPSDGHPLPHTHPVCAHPSCTGAQAHCPHRLDTPSLLWELGIWSLVLQMSPIQGM